MQTADTTLFAVIMEAYLHGTSTRKGPVTWSRIS
jgi:hypothetical protein